MPPEIRTQPPAFTRADLVRQAISGNPWHFIAAWEPKLRQTPSISGEAADELRVLAAHSLGKLGLRTLALEHLRNLSPQAAAQPGVEGAILATERLKPDAITSTERIELCRGNLASVANRGDLPPALADQFETWAAQIEQTRAFRTLSGVPVLQRLVNGVWVWTHLCDQVALAASLVSGKIAPGPIFLDGLHAPMVVRRLVQITPRTAMGLESLITLIAADETELLDALSLADLRPELGLRRVRLIVGPDAAATLEARLRERIDQPLGLLAVMPGAPPTPGRFTPEQLTAVVQKIGQEQRAMQDAEGVRVSRMYQECDGTWWRTRFERRDGEPPLRVLIPTTRFSSFLQHSASDIADALRQAGCDARVFIEPDEYSSFSNLGLARMIGQMRPDLVLLINITRSQLRDVLPENVPVVTWVQDTMPQLFDQGAGAAMGPLDFIVGHLHQDLFTHFRYPARRVLHSPVVASGRKFTSDAVERALLDKHACEIAYVSHHGESPEQCRDRIVRESAGGPNAWLAPLLATTFDAICDAGKFRVVDGSVDRELRRIVQDGVRRALAREPEPRQIAMVHYSVARPIAERANRHQMVSWAADICRRRGWRLHLYGRGWDKSPEFAPFAKGELAHGEELRAAYQAAGVHLQGGLAGVLHQRVMECALSGGLPLIRFTYDALESIECLNAIRLTLDGIPPAFSLLSDRTMWVPPSDHPDSAAIVRLRQYYGLPILPGAQHHARFLQPDAEFERAMAVQREAVWLPGDCTQTTFDTRDALEALVEKALGMPRGKRQLSGGIAARTRAALTYDAVMDRTLAMIRAELADGNSLPLPAISAQEAA